MGTNRAVLIDPHYVSTRRRPLQQNGCPQNTAKGRMGAGEATLKLTAISINRPRDDARDGIHGAWIKARYVAGRFAGISGPWISQSRLHLTVKEGRGKVLGYASPSPPALSSEASISDKCLKDSTVLSLYIWTLRRASRDQLATQVVDNSAQDQNEEVFIHSYIVVWTSLIVQSQTK